MYAICCARVATELEEHRWAFAGLDFARAQQLAHADVRDLGAGHAGNKPSAGSSRATAATARSGELIDMSIWWDRAGAPLKVPSLGAHLSLEHSVADDVGDLLLATCVDLSLGSHSFVRS
jgi:hypothetical protein